MPILVNPNNPNPSTEPTILRFPPGWWHSRRVGLPPVVDHEALLRERSTTYDEAAKYKLATDIQPKERQELSLVNTDWHTRLHTVVLTCSKEYPTYFDKEKSTRLAVLCENMDSLNQTASTYESTARMYRDTSYLNGQEAWEITSEAIKDIKTTVESALPTGTVPGPLMLIYQRIHTEEVKRAEEKEGVRTRLENAFQAGKGEVMKEFLAMKDRLDDLQHENQSLRRQLDEFVRAKTQNAPGELRATKRGG